MLSGETKLLLSYRQIVARHPLAFSLDSRHWWLDHPGFNCDSTKILFLFRDCADPLNPSPWRTDMFTCDLDGGNLACSLPDIYWRNMVSHQLWGRTPSEIVVDANWRGEGHEYLVFDMRDLPPLAKRISRGMGPMAHLVFSPDGKWLLADTYPDKQKIQRLAAVEVATGRLALLREFKHPQPDGFPVDLRCDLHPRWSRDGSVVTVDSIDDGTRGIYMLDFRPELLF
jgi:hypothetical protein